MRREGCEVLLGGKGCGCEVLLGRCVISEG